MKKSTIALAYLLIIPFNIFAAEYQLDWMLKGKYGDTSFTTNVYSNQRNLIIQHYFSYFSFSTLMNGVANEEDDQGFFSLVSEPTYLSVGENNQATIHYDKNSAATLNLFPLMHNQVVNHNTINPLSINNLPVSAGLVPIPFLPASSVHLNGATIASITTSQNSVQVSLNFLEELQCDDCVTNLTLTQESNGYLFTVHHSGSLEGVPHYFTLTTHITVELMSVLINGETVYQPPK